MRRDASFFDSLCCYWGLIALFFHIQSVKMLSLEPRHSHAVLPTFSDVEAAAARLRGVAHRTPVLRSRQADGLAGAQLHFKCENLQRMGAFKFRGAYNAVAQLSPEQRRTGVLTYSSGNHAQAVALSAQLLGARAVILMPHDSAPSKVAATQGYGAEVSFYDRLDTDRDALAAQVAAERGLSIVPPYADANVIAGQGTAAMELLQETGPLDLLLCTLGGGGLLAGTAIAAAALSPGCKVIGVEPVYGDDGLQSLRAGKVVRIPTPQGLPEGALSNEVGALNFAVIQQHVHDIVTVTDDDIVEAMKFYASRMKLVVEPTGALSLAAVLQCKVESRGLRVGLIVSGGNVDLSRLAKLVA